MEQIQIKERSAFEIAMEDIEHKHKDYFEDRNDNIFNHILFTIEDSLYYMEWKPGSDLSPKIRHEISKVFHSLHAINF